MIGWKKPDEPCCICGEKACDHLRHKNKGKEIADHLTNVAKEIGGDEFAEAAAMPIEMASEQMAAEAVKQSPFANLLDGMLLEPRQTVPFRGFNPPPISLAPYDVLAMPEKVELVHDIRAAIHDRAVNAWRDYYDEAEARDRAHPHGLPRREGGGVISICAGVFGHPGYKDLIQRRKERLSGIDKTVSDAAKEDAAIQHEAELRANPCPCETCRRNR